MRNKRVNPYPKLSALEKVNLTKVLLSAKEDFRNGITTCLEMRRLDPKAEWIQRSLEYYRNCFSAARYIEDKLKIVPKEEKS